MTVVLALEILVALFFGMIQWATKYLSEFALGVTQSVFHPALTTGSIYRIHWALFASMLIVIDFDPYKERQSL